MAVLGISANSRIIGTAILEKDILLDYGVRLLKHRWSFRKADKIIAHIATLIDDYGIMSIALTIPYAHYESKETQALIGRIRTFCRTKKIHVSSYHPKTLHAFCPQAKAKKKGLMECLVTLYPELRASHSKELRNKRERYHKLFEAVAAATLHVRGLDGKKHASL